MPSYDYLCQACMKMFEVRIPVSAYSAKFKPKCPECGSRKVARAFTTFNVLTPRSGGEASGGRCGPMAGPGCCGS